jgi:hypothetical protein
MGRHLVYTVALDAGGTTGHRNLAKMLVSSLLRTRFSGDILVFHNSPHPLFMVARKGVREVRLTDVAPVDDFRAFSQSRKHAVAGQIDPAGYDKVMFIDCDSLVLRNPDHLLAGDWNLAFYAEMRTRIQDYPYGGYLSPKEEQSLTREGINSGTWAVAAPHLGEFLERWRNVEAIAPARHSFLREQSAFNRVVLDWKGPVFEWPRREIAMPLCWPNLVRYDDYSRATIVHAAGGGHLDHKLRFLFSAFAGRFLFDPQLALFNILEM